MMFIEFERIKKSDNTVSITQKYLIVKKNEYY